jgi:hypothetical protein
MSHSTLGRIERGSLVNVTISQLARACAAVGLKLVARAYPDGDPVRDVAHLNLLGRLRREIAPSAGWRTEVPIPIAGDLRAWDAQAVLQGTIVAIEAEVRIHDLQALERRVALKRRDSGVNVVILLIADTPANRRRLAEQREDLRTSF